MVDGKCKRCGKIETNIHAMFLCPFMKNLWDKVFVLLVPGLSTVRSIDELLKVYTRMIILPPVGLTSPVYPWIMWVLWTSRK